MRAVLAGILAMMTITAQAKPLTPVPDAPFFLRLPSDAHVSASFARQAGQSDGLQWRQADTPSQQDGMSFGPIHAEAVQSSRPGKRRSIMQYRLEGVDVLGGAVGGSLDGRGAVITLHWQGQ